MIINAKTILTGLFASPSTHSISPIMHNNAFEKLGLNFAYLSFEVNKDNLKDAVKSIKTLNMRGVNLSMPNKKEVIQYLDEISEIAKLSQSVNTIVNDNGILKGYSTDGKGFFKSLEEENINIKNKYLHSLAPTRPGPMVTDAKRKDKGCVGVPLVCIILCAWNLQAKLE